MKLKILRDKIAWFIASKEGKKNLTEGVTDDNFYDFGAYVDLIAKSLRRMANDRHSNTVMNWLIPEDWHSLPEEELELLSDKETVRLNKWADILEISDSDLDDDPRFNDYFLEMGDYLFGSKRPMSEERQASGLELHNWENSIRDLKSDILGELGANFFYMWD